MKRQIRRGVFETNSSSIHSLTICSKEEYKQWERGEKWFNSWSDKFVEPSDDLEQEIDHNGVFKSPDDFYDYYNEWLETMYEEYTTKHGEQIVAFGYYGIDN